MTAVKGSDGIWIPEYGNRFLKANTTRTSALAFASSHSNHRFMHTRPAAGLTLAYHG
jgi:hypothetical protein